MARTSATIAWTAFALAIVVAAGLGVLLWNERRANDTERARLDEMRSTLQRQAEQTRGLTDRITGLEQSNRDLQERLSTIRRPPAHAEVAAVALPSGPRFPAIELVDAMPSVDLRLAGESSAPLPSLDLTPSEGWPVAERLAVPRATNPFTDPTTMRRMYITYAALQATDITTTLVGLSRGGYEANPFVRGIADKPAALIAVTVGTSVGTYFLIERLHKQKPMAAAITLAAINSTLAVVAVSNIKAAHAAKE
jgi:hypothetical protein